MKLSLNWLADFVAVKSNLKTLAEKITERVAEIERVTRTGVEIPHVVVGKILKIEPIAGADKIRLTTVDVGIKNPKSEILNSKQIPNIKSETSDTDVQSAIRNPQSKILKIICGAQNIHEGAFVPVALVGAELPGEFKIIARKMKGVESNGMICSEAELGLAEKSEGILLLPTECEKHIGEPLSAVLPSDTILEIENTAITHRPDLFSIVGFAREIAVIEGRGNKEGIKNKATSGHFVAGKNKASEIPNTKYQIPNTKLKLPEAKGKLLVAVEEKSLCPRYSGLKITGIKVQPSPKKIQERLASVGIRAINNVVDATNYVMYELGEPMHAFDAEKIAQEKIYVRFAKADETLKTLDGGEQKLIPEMLVIADAEKPLAIAGVMGGANSEVENGTTTIILEAANFDAVSVRRTSTALGIRTESSLRFEKRLDPNLPPVALARCVEILRITCPDLKIEASADVVNFKPEKRVIEITLAEINRKLGTELESKEVVEILEALEFGVERIKNKAGKNKASKKLTTNDQLLTTSSESEISNSGILNTKYEIPNTNFLVSVPSFRAGRDVESAENIVEEIARHIGYNNLPIAFPTLALTTPKRSRENELARSLEDILVGAGFCETCTLALTSEKLLRTANEDLTNVPVLLNPPTEDHKYLRSSLVASLLEVAQRNIHTLKTFRLFEIANVFESNDQERKACVALIVGEEDAFARAKGVAEVLFQALELAVSFEPIDSANLPKQAHPGRAAQILCGQKKVGVVAELHPALATSFELPRSAYLLLDFATLATLESSIVIAKPLPKFPGITRDLAVVVPEKTLARDIIRAISKADARVTDVKLFDTYTGKNLPIGTKSLAFSFTFLDETKTLSDAEAEQIFATLVKNVERAGGKLR